MVQAIRLVTTGERMRIVGQLPNGKYLVEAMLYEPGPAAGGSVNLVVAGAPAEGPNMVISGNSSISVIVKEEFTSNEGPGSGSWTDRNILRFVASTYLRLSAMLSMILDIGEVHQFARLMARMTILCFWTIWHQANIG